MAGIAGFINTQAGNHDVLEEMGKLINHRGPDYSDVYEDEKAHIIYKGLSIGHPMEGREMFKGDDTILCITGIVDNHNEIAEYAKEKGVNVKEDSSTSEVLAALYEAEGTAFANRMKGNFLITIWDRKAEELVFIRDVFGFQPIYYYRTDNGGMIFASELKGILAHPEFKKKFNEKALRPYLTFQSPITEETFFKGVWKFPPASSLRFKDGRVSIEKYWTPSFDEQDRSLEEFQDLIQNRVQDSIDEKTALNKKVGSFLSGGVDSSYVASVAKVDKTFTVGYSDKEFSEIDNAVALSKIIGCENINESLDGDECFEKLGDMQYMMDEPSANPSIVPLYFLSKLAKESGVDSVLSGEGADEFFAGYFEYKTPEEIEKYKALPEKLRRFNGRLAKKLPANVKGRNFFMKGGLPVEEYYIGQAKIFTEKETLKMVKPAYKVAPSVKSITDEVYRQVQGLDDISKKQFLDFNLWVIADINPKADRMSMASSLQIITPLLDRDLWEIARTLPQDLKIHDGQEKYAFRQTALRELPEEWATRPKKGFPVPIRHWVRDDKYYAAIMEAFTSEEAKKFFETDQLVKLLEDHRNGKKNNQRKIWTVYVFILWYREYFIKR